MALHAEVSQRAVGLFMDTRLNETRKTHTPRAKRLPDSRTLQAADFETLLSDFSAALVRVSVADIDSEIECWLERIVLAMDADRGNVLQVDPTDGGIYLTHQWGRAGVVAPDRGRKTDSTKWYPWLLGKVRSGELVVFSRLDELPPEAYKDAAAARQMGGKSNVTIPLKVGGTDGRRTDGWHVLFRETLVRENLLALETGGGNNRKRTRTNTQ